MALDSSVDTSQANLQDFANTQYNKLSLLRQVLGEALGEVNSGVSLGLASLDWTTKGSVALDTWLESEWQIVRQQVQRLATRPQEGAKPSKSATFVDLGLLNQAFEALNDISETAGVTLHRPVTQHTGELNFEVISLLEALPGASSAATHRMRVLETEKMALTGEIATMQNTLKECEAQLLKTRQVS